MAFMYSPFGQSAEDFEKETAANRIGRRIRAIRTAQGLSQGELGEKVDLNANRVQQYENGARKPKFDLCKKFAEALDVETSALLDPEISNYIGAMYAFFEMETLYDLRLKRDDGRLYITFGESLTDTRVSSLNKYLELWYERRKKAEEDILNCNSEEEKKEILHEYNMWEWNFPFSSEENGLSKSERAKKARAAQMLSEILKRGDN